MVLFLVLDPELVEESVPVLVLVQATAAGDQVRD